MSNKNIAIGTAAVLILIIAITIASKTNTTIQSINPLAAITAITVAIIGLAWFKKTAKP